MNVVRTQMFALIQVNDLLRRKEPSHLGDIGVTEVNKSAGAVWSRMDDPTAAGRYTNTQNHTCL